MRFLPSPWIGLLALAGCSSPSATPEQLRSALLSHPDILYSVVRAHPDSFIAILTAAARDRQRREQAVSVMADSLRIEHELAHPRLVPTAGRAGFGDPSAPVTIVEYTDFQCPYCRQERDVLVEVLKAYPGRVRLVVKQLPVETHQHAYAAAVMFEAVARQDPAAAYRLYDLLYTNQEQFNTRGEAYLADAVKQAGADLARAQGEAASEAVKATVAADVAEATKLGFTGTPGFLINGVSLQGAYPRGVFDRVINRELAAIGRTAP